MIYTCDGKTYNTDGLKLFWETKDNTACVKIYKIAFDNWLGVVIDFDTNEISAIVMNNNDVIELFISAIERDW